MADREPSPHSVLFSEQQGSPEEPEKRFMDVLKMLADLRHEREQIEEAILTLERLALKEKGNLFEEVFGMKAVVRNAESTKGLVADG